MTGNLLAWLAALDVVAAVVFALIVRAISRRSRHPLPPRSTTALAAFLALPAVLFYGAVWLYWRLIGG